MPTFDPTKPVQTRDGRPARILCTDFSSSGGGQPILAAIMNGNGTESAHTFTTEGHLFVDNTPMDIDLVNVPEEHELFLNVYLDELACPHPTLEKASDCQSSNVSPRLGVLRIVHADGKLKTVGIVRP